MVIATYITDVVPWGQFLVFSGNMGTDTLY